MSQGQGGPPPGWPEPPPAGAAGAFGPGNTVPGDGFAPAGGEVLPTAPAAPLPEPMGIADLGGMGAPDAAPLGIGPPELGSPFAIAPPAPPATTINDVEAPPAPGIPPGPVAGAPPAHGPGIPLAPMRAAPRRSTAAMLVGITGIAVAMAGVITFVLIRSGTKDEADADEEVATIVLPPEPAPVPSTPPETPPQPAATEPTVEPPAPTAPPPTQPRPPATQPRPQPSPPPGSATPPGSARPPLRRPGTVRPPGSARPPASGRPTIVRPGRPRPKTSPKGDDDKPKKPKIVRPK